MEYYCIFCQKKLVLEDGCLYCNECADPELGSNFIIFLDDLNNIISYIMALELDKELYLFESSKDDNETCLYFGDPEEYKEIKIYSYFNAPDSVKSAKDLINRIIKLDVYT